MPLVLACTEAPVAGSCPEGSAVWVEVSTLSPFPELSAAEVSDLQVAAFGLLLTAWCLKAVRKQLVNV